ncbi:conserved hypothetical protein [Ixodes scapularis]|uniref:Uncharacterized protein n=2 Tax=Ixodes scapularis TaxID=6945 RepID=B7PX91_IXOSC|nr:conserved hypothetical protein [Ixodes scapularis]|eukprot:XP_002399648.1 conserved hypothetical protein [Ixodes scapularis]
MSEEPATESTRKDGKEGGSKHKKRKHHKHKHKHHHSSTKDKSRRKSSAEQAPPAGPTSAQASCQPGIQVSSMNLEELEEQKAILQAKLYTLVPSDYGSSDEDTKKVKKSKVSSKKSQETSSKKRPHSPSVNSTKKTDRENKSREHSRSEHSRRERDQPPSPRSSR